MSRQVVCPSCQSRARLPDGGGADFLCPRCRSPLPTEAVTTEPGERGDEKAEGCPVCGEPVRFPGDACPACLVRLGRRAPEGRGQRSDPDASVATAYLMLGGCLTLLLTFMTLAFTHFPLLTTGAAILILGLLFLAVWGVVHVRTRERPEERDFGRVAQGWLVVLGVLFFVGVIVLASGFIYLLGVCASGGR